MHLMFLSFRKVLGSFKFGIKKLFIFYVLSFGFPKAAILKKRRKRFWNNVLFQFQNFFTLFLAHELLSLSGCPGIFSQVKEVTPASQYGARNEKTGHFPVTTFHLLFLMNKTFYHTPNFYQQTRAHRIPAK